MNDDVVDVISDQFPKCLLKTSQKPKQKQPLPTSTSQSQALGTETCIQIHWQLAVGALNTTQC